MNRCCNMYDGQESNFPRCWVMASKSNIFDGGVLKNQSINYLIIIFNLSTATNMSVYP